MIRFAGFEFDLDKTLDGSKATKREHLKKVWEISKKQPASLKEQPPLPEEAAHVWWLYHEVYGATHLTYLEIQAWASLTGRYLEPWEIRALIALDRRRWGVMSDGQGKA